MDKNKNTCREFISLVNSIRLYRGLQMNVFIKTVYELCNEVLAHGEAGHSPWAAKALAILVENGEKWGFSGNIYEKSIYQIAMGDENIFSLACERNEITPGNPKGYSIYSIAREDIDGISRMAGLDMPAVIAGSNAASIREYRPMKGRGRDYAGVFGIDCLVKRYNEMGVGEMAFSAMFKYHMDENTLSPVKKPDSAGFHSIIGYEGQKQAVKSNTEAFIKGYPASDTLLSGARGTGKSTMVKALAHAYFKHGLRIIEITKEQIVKLPLLMQLLSHRGCKFIVFIDDLSFEDFEVEYKYLKSLLEGGSEARPDNVLIYATSNRRHIIQEKWSDKHTNPEDEEIHTSDMMNEKLSLSDRFGLIVTFPKPSPKEYMGIVEGLAEMKGLQIPGDLLRQKALSWELNNKGLSGRTAKQFIDSLLWEFNTFLN